MGRAAQGARSRRMRPRDAWRWAALLLLFLFSDVSGGRRGAGGRTGSRGGGGGGSSAGLRGGFRAVSRGGGSPGRGSKVAGAIAAGAAAGYGMGLLGRPRPSRLGHGIPAARQPAAASGFHAPGWPDMGVKRGPPNGAHGDRRGGISPVLLLAPAVCFMSRGLQR